MDIIIDRFSPNHLTLCFMLESFAKNLYVLGKCISIFLFLYLFLLAR